MSTLKTWIKPLARAGYSSRGIVYLIIGGFAALAAFGGGAKTNSKGALEKILSQPFGTVLVWIMIVGLVGYVLWRLIQAIADTDDHGWSPKGLAVRAGLLASAFTYTTLALYALAISGVIGGGGNSGKGGNPVSDAIAGLIGTTFVSLGLALIFAGICIAHWWKAATGKYADHIDASEAAMRFVHPISKIGLFARGAVFAVISILLSYRALNAQPSNGSPPGIKQAMEFVQDLPFGSILLSALGLGIMLFAIYSFIEGRWRRINVDDANGI